MKPAATQCRNRPMMPASMGKKKGTPKGTFFTTKLRSAAAGARQELRVQVRAVGVVATTPAEDGGSTDVGRGHRRRRAARVLHGNQGDHRTVDIGRGSKALYRHHDLPVDVRRNRIHVLRGAARRDACDFATPVVGSRRARGTLED